MPYLQGKDYVASKKSKKEVTAQKKTSLKSTIKTFCPKDKKKSYEEIIAKIRKDETDHYTNDELVEIIEQLKKKDADYKLPEPVVEELT